MGIMAKNNFMLHFVKYTYLFALSVITLVLMFKGPISSILKDETVFNENPVNWNDIEEPLELPWMSICRAPQFKNATFYYDLIYKNHTNAGIEELIKSTFYNDVNDTLITLAMSTTYEATLASLNNSEVLNNVAFVITTDLTYTGKCIVVSLEKLRAVLVKRGELKGTEKDFTFQAIFLLKASEYPSGGFAISFHKDGENASVGLDNLFPSPRLFVEQGKIQVTNIDFKYTKKIRNCNADAKLITPCLYSAVSHIPNVLERNNYLTNIKIGGPDLVKNMTGCILPCDTIEYITKVFTTVDRKVAYDPANLKFKTEYKNENGTIFVLSHIKSDTIIVNEEFPRYNALTFLGDTGGIIGLFLGYSFWSIYELLIEPIFKCIQSKLR